jgi:Flp pilus assembly protein TadD
VVFPGLLFALGLTDAAAAGRPFVDRLRETLRRMAGVLIVVGTYAASRFAMVAGYFAHTSGNADIASRGWVAVEAFGYYTMQALLPVPLGPERYPPIPDAPWNIPVLLGWISLAGLACWLRWTWVKRPIAAFGLLWFLCTLVPVLAALPVTRTGEFVLAERWLYAPSAGMTLAVAATVQPWLTGAGNPRRVRFAGAALVVWGVLALGTLFWITPIWASNTTFHRYILARNPGAPGPLTNVAILEIEAGRPEVAARLLQKAAARSPADTKVWVNLGLALRQLKRYDEALTAFQKSMDLNPEWVVPPTFMSSVYYDTGRYAEGIALMQPVVRRAPHYAYGHFFLGVFQENAGRLEDAVTSYGETIRLSPKNLNAFRNLARTHVRMGSLGAAIATLEAGLAVSPGAPSLQMDLARLYDQAGQNVKARPLWEALAAQSADPELSRVAAERLAR